MYVHLAFVKLEQGPGAPARVERLVGALAQALSPWGATVRVAADDHARAAWDVSVEAHGTLEHLESMADALAEALQGWPVGAAKGWSFGAPS